ncbi:hypothetical protein HMPREF9123_2405 [Neisseria bacilliformis ATCC BAA-1200]|uniref:Uncharacterized protein n=1 Tax=Neisseria bacilliformis ATCC BAA-1200 TaxID=888742 RepID=F2BF98_9NEIS|nr:hypothetical protein HMPREF9123_2405 [Neisseria bacilliformis ATCC BAA-1200]
MHLPFYDAKSASKVECQQILGLHWMLLICICYNKEQKKAV